MLLSPDPAAHECCAPRSRAWHAAWLKKRRRFLAADPLTHLWMRYDAPIVTVTHPTGAWRAAEVTALNVALAQLGAGLTLTLADRRPEVWTRITGTSTSVLWAGTAQSFIVPAVERRGWRVE